MGSLFQLREFWNTPVQSELSPSAFLLGNFDHDPQNEEKVAIGSFDGRLQIHQVPSAEAPSHFSSLLCEHCFEEPILQISFAGFEVVHDNVLQNLAILFPQRIAFARVFKFVEEVEFPTKEESMEKVSFFVYKLVVYFETPLAHSSYNMICGQFGRAMHDIVCVQSVDGHLTFLDHNKILFSGWLPSNEFLLPGHLAYATDQDSLITNNSSMFLLSYSFPSIVNAFQTEENHLTEVDIEAKISPSSSKLKPSWAFNVGEDVVALKVCRCVANMPGSDRNIVVLSPYCISVLGTTGFCLFTKRLEVECVALEAFFSPGNGIDHLLVALADGSIAVHSSKDLLWSAKMSMGSAKAITVGRMGEVNGMIAVLRDDNTVAVNYLGTDPSEAPLQWMESRIGRYADMVDELEVVNERIKKIEENTSSPLKKLSSSSPDPQGDRVVKKTEEKPSIVISMEVSPLGYSKEHAEVEICISIALCTSALDDIATNVYVHASAVEPLEPNKAITRCRDLRKYDSPVAVVVLVTVGKNLLTILPSSLEFKCAVSATIAYQTYFTTQSIGLPIGLVATIYPVPRSMPFSLQLNTDKATPPSLLDIFKDLRNFGHFESNALCLQYTNGVLATVLVSKNAGRFKVQSSNLQGVSLLCNELISGLKKYYAEKGEQVVFEFLEELSVKDYLPVLDLHRETRNQVKDAECNLEKSARFFRAVQKRMLSRFREKTPSDMKALEILLLESAHMLQGSTDLTVESKLRLKQVSAAVNASLQLLSTVLSVLKKGLVTENNLLFLRSVLQCPVSGEADENWLFFFYQVLQGIKMKHEGNVIKDSASPDEISVQNVEEHLVWLVNCVRSGKVFSS